MNTATLKIAVAQLNCTVGDLAGNAARISAAAAEAKRRGAHVLLTPELALCGYPPEDLLLRADFYRSCARQLAQLAEEAAQGIALLVGHPLEDGGLRYNAASLLQDGKVQATYRKVRLPNYEVFDELRYFAWGDEACVVSIQGVPVGINICADVWEQGAAEQARAAGAELLLVLNASPYHMDKQSQRYAVMRERVRHTGMAAVYCNLVGGQDELVFDGASFALDAEGTVAYQAPLFEERLDVLEYAHGRIRADEIAPLPCLEAAVTVR